MDIRIPETELEQIMDSALFKAFWDNISDGALAIDVNSRQILAMNQKAQDVLGYKLDDVVGCQCKAMMNSTSCATACPLTALLQGNKKRSRLPLMYRGKSSNIRLHAETKMLLIRDTTGKPMVGVELFRDVREIKALKKALAARRSLAGLVGSSAEMQQVYQLIEQVAPYDIPILVTGDSGVGKERVAEAIQQLSSRKDKPFIKVNCAALSPTLVESELFGHRKGAFTGACRERKGYIEEAHEGTILLDEVGELPMPLQAKLLRFVQEGELQRLGEEHIRKVNVRILAATNRSLHDEIQSGRFRADLYYRLLGAHIHIPTLTERKEDIPQLAEHMLQVFVNEQQAFHPTFKEVTLSPEAMQTLLEHDWPGNARELGHMLRLAAIKAQTTGRIQPLHLPLTSSTTTPSPQAPHNPPIESPPVQTEPAPFLTLAEREAQAIQDATERANGNLTEAARLLGIDRSTLWRKQKRK